MVTCNEWMNEDAPSSLVEMSTYGPMPWIRHDTGVKNNQPTFLLHVSTHGPMPWMGHDTAVDGPWSYGWIGHGYGYTLYTPVRSIKNPPTFLLQVDNCHTNYNYSTPHSSGQSRACQSSVLSTLAVFDRYSVWVRWCSSISPPWSWTHIVFPKHLESVLA